MRRRALLAASGASGGGGGESFYAEFFFDYCEESFFGKYCYRASDYLGVACYNEAVRLLDTYGVVVDSFGNLITLENPINYGFEVYVEGVLVTRLSREYGALFLNMAEGEYTYAKVAQTGELDFEF